MTTRFTFFVAAAALAPALLAQYQPAPPTAPSAMSPAPGAPFAPAQLDQLLAPVALYPDPLLGTMLPASTHPDQIAAAATFIADHPDPSLIDQQPWDDSVKALAHYPEVLTWMARNPDWTAQLGSAVALQQPDVMTSFQRLRGNAQASGLLANTPQQQVIVQHNAVSIVPTQPGMVYVPYYDPQYVETGVPPGATVGLQFGAGYALDSWAFYGLDWGAHAVWYRPYHREGDHDWRRFAASDRDHETWRPSEDVVRSQPRSAERGRAEVVRPSPLPPSRWNEHTRTPGLTPTGRGSGYARNRQRANPNYSRRPEVRDGRRDDHSDDHDHRDDDR